MLKTVRILTQGSISALNGVSGPIYTPVKLDTSVITSIIYENHKVVEVLPDGSELPLDYANVANNNAVLMEEELHSIDQHKSKETHVVEKKQKGKESQQEEPVKEELK